MKSKNFKSLLLICSTFIAFAISSNDQDNSRPIADAGNTQYTNTGELIKLNASNSTDVDGDKLSYHWQIVAKPETSNARLERPNHVTSNISIDAAGTYQIELIVSDGEDISDASVVEISTLETKPVFPELHDQKERTGSLLMLDHSAYDPDGDDLSYQWQLLRKPVGSSANLKVTNLIQNELITDRVGTYLIGIDVADKKHVLHQEFRVFAVDELVKVNRSTGCVLDQIFYDGFDGLLANNQPVANVGDDRLGVIGQIMNLDGSGSFDIDLDDLSYQWSLLSAPQNSQASIVNDTNINAELSPDIVGDYVAQLMVNDGCLDSDPDSALVTISVNQSPTIDSNPELSVFSSQNYSYQVTATDPENHNLTYSLTTSPNDMTIDSNGLINWQASIADTYSIVVKVTDEFDASATQGFDLIVADNQVPVISSVATTDIVVNQPFNYQVIATDPESHELTYELMTSPNDMTIDSSGLVNWETSIANTYPVIIKVTDEFDASATQSFDIVVTDNQVPVISSMAATDIVVSQPFSYQITATDPEDHELTYSIMTSPSGMMVDADGLVSWQAPVANIYPVTIKVTDQYGAFAMQSFDLNVTDNQAPIISSTPQLNILSTFNFNYQVTATDPENHDISYSLMSAPSGMVVNSSGLVNWQAGSAGNYPVIIKVEDQYGAFVTQSFDLSVTINQAPIISSSATTEAVVGESYDYQITASDPEGHDISYSLMTAPSTMNISLNGLITWDIDAAGMYPVTVRVEDQFGAFSTQNFTINVTNNQAPTINSSALTDVIEAHLYSYSVIATDAEGHNLTYSLTNAPLGMSIDTSGLISWLALAPNTYAVTVVVEDEFGASDTQSFDIVVTQNHAPVIQSWPISEGEKDNTYTYQLTVTDSDGDLINYSLINPPTDMSISLTGELSWEPLAQGVYPIEIRVDDGANATDIQNFDLVINELPPNPSDIATALSKTEYTPFIDSIDFLYKNDPPVQIGMPVDTIKAYRTAVITGKVLDDDDMPLSGIKVTINNHPEYGHTFTMNNGVFFMVVNGGGTLTVNFAKGGYLTAQRDIKTPWEEYAYVEDLILVRLDEKVTTVDLTDISEPYQVAQGSPVTDVDGTRQATLLFPAGTSAVMTLPDGSSQDISELNIRATEYTVGENGPQRMPADLPAGSAYTYAVELSVDQALDLNASKVEFNQDVIFYLENFIGFPAGVSVPTGWYDKEQAYWIPSDNGLVIKILRIENDKAILDVTDNNIDNDATQSELNALGIDDNELVKLAELYSADQSLWRVLIPHFTPWDHNWPYVPPTDIIDPPEVPSEYGDDEQSEKDDNDDSCSGCEIIAQDRTLQESIPVTGTDLTLKYTSESSKKFGNYSIRITGPTIPDSLEKIELIIITNNLNAHYEYQPTANLTQEIDWDGRDLFGRQVHNLDVEYIIKYTFPAIYSPSLSETERVFSQIAARGVNVEETDREALKIITLAKNTVQFERSYSVINSNVETSQVNLDGIKEEQLKLGGWGISNHHVYDPHRETLYQGDGFIRKTSSLGGFLGRIPFGYGHAGPATATSAGIPTVITTSPNGEVFFAGSFRDNLGHDFLMIRKVTLDGTVFTVASTSTDVNCEVTEMQDAFLLCLNDINSLYVNDAGEVYFHNRKQSDGTNLIRKIDINGLVTTIAGNSTGTTDDGVLATSARIDSINHMKFDKHGNLFLLSDSKLRKIDTNGIITTVAGDGDIFNIEDGILATESSLDSATGFDIGDDGSIYIADFAHECIRHVTTDGYMYKFFDSNICIGGFRRNENTSPSGYPTKVEIDSNGNLISLYTSDEDDSGAFHKSYKFGMSKTINNNQNGFIGDEGDFSQAEFSHPNSFVLSKSDEIFIADTINNRIRKVTSSNIVYTYSGDGNYDFNEGSRAANKTQSISSDVNNNKTTSEFIFIPSRDGSLLHQFSRNGVHRKTIDSLTGKELVRFIYSNVGVLSQIVDADGLITTINRDENDLATSINSHYGKETKLEYFGSGRLKTVTDPLENHWNMEYTSGLLSAFIDRNNNRYQYTYNDEFLLVSDLNPIGGGWSLSTVNDNQTKMTSAEGREYLFEKSKSEFDEILTNTASNGATSTNRISPNGDTLVSADGTSMTKVSSGTQRLGNNVKFSRERHISTPSGLQLTTINSLNETEFTPGSLSPVAQSIYRSTINGQNWTNEYNQSFGTNSGYKMTTPEGRVYEINLNNFMDVQSSGANGFYPTQVIYDADRRVEKVTIGTGADKRESTFTYYNSGSMNGELHTVTNPLGRIISFEYDDNGRISKQTFPDLREVTYSYDGNGNLKSLTPPSKPAHFFNYNGMDQEVQYIPPSLTGITSPETSYTYNLDEQITNITRPDGQEINYTYNSSNGNLENKTIPRGTYTYSYETVSGRLKQTSSPDGVTLDYAFDGYLPTSTTWSGTHIGSVSRAYDNLFRVTSRTVNGTSTINFGYDNDDLLISAGALTMTREAQKNGLIKSTTIGSITTATNYSNFAELSSYNAQYNSSDIYDVVFTRDKIGRIKSKTEVINSISTIYEYEYDLAGRLIEEKINSIVTNTWGYDDNGNRININGSLVATYDNQDRLLTYDNSIYTYNENGELESKTSGLDNTVYNYDVLGHLVSVSKPDGTLIEYLTDARGRRVAKKINGDVTRRWLYKDKLNPIAELDASGNIVSRFIYGDRGNVPSYMERDGVTYRIISNHLGSPLKVIDITTGNVLQELQYDVWGNILNNSNPDFQPFGFAGGIYDTDTKLTRFGARDYDSISGRWTVKDPSRFYGNDPNLLNYVYNDPVNFLDTTGKGAVAPVAAWIGTDTAVPDPSDAAWPKWVAYAGLLGGAYLIDSIFFNDDADNSDQGESEAKPKKGRRGNPDQGEPNTWEEHPHGKQDRYYGPDGKPLIDIDYSHDHGQGVPHQHDWIDGVRQPGKPVDPNNPCK